MKLVHCRCPDCLMEFWHPVLGRTNTWGWNSYRCTACETKKETQLNNIRRALLEVMPTCHDKGVQIPFVSKSIVGFTCDVCGRHGWIRRDADSARQIAQLIFGVGL